MKLEKESPPSSTRAKSSPFRPAKYPNNYEKPSYGAPTDDGSDMDLAQVRHKGESLPPFSYSGGKKGSKK